MVSKVLLILLGCLSLIYRGMLSTHPKVQGQKKWVYKQASIACRHRPHFTLIFLTFLGGCRATDPIGDEVL